MKHRNKQITLSLGFCLFSSIASAQFSESFDLNTLNGSNGFKIHGLQAQDLFGSAVSSAGDINSDGIDDLLFSSIGSDTNGSSTGSTYLMLGREEVFSAAESLSSTLSFNGIAIGDTSGQAVSHIGDVNDDGIDDFITTSMWATVNNVSFVGQSYVVFGSTTPFSASTNLSTLNGTNGFIINGVEDSEQSGVSASAAGDINNDGIDDFIIGSFKLGTGNPGGAYVVFGNSNGFTSPMNVNALNGSNGFRINGFDNNNQTGGSVSSAGDFNNDGIDDLIIGARKSDNNGSDSGTSFVVFGSSSAFSSQVELFFLDGSNGVKIHGNAGDNSGRSVAGIGDLNADGIDDVIIGAERVDANGTNSGAAYVVFGKSTAFTSSLNLSTLDGSNGFLIKGIAANDWTGNSVHVAGDINADGINDLIIGASKADANGVDSGAAYVVFGKRSGFSHPLELSALNGTDGFSIKGRMAGDELGYSVSTAGDVNFDGIDDIVVGALYSETNGTNTGTSYVIFGTEVIFTNSFEGDGGGGG